MDHFLASIENFSQRIEVRRGEMKRRVCEWLDARFDQAQHDLTRLTKRARRIRDRMAKKSRAIPDANDDDAPAEVNVFRAECLKNQSVTIDLNMPSTWGVRQPHRGKRVSQHRGSTSAKRSRTDDQNPAQGVIKPYSCAWPRCDFRSEWRISVSGHIRMKHLKLPKTLKEQAARHIVDNRDAGDFIRKDAALKAELKRHSRFVCKWVGCRKRFRDSTNLSNHERVHVRIKPFSCAWPHCDYRSEQPGAVFQHIRIQHFKLPKTVKEQTELHIVDTRDANGYIRVDETMLRQ